MPVGGAYDAVMYNYLSGICENIRKYGVKIPQNVEMFLEPD